MVKEGCYMMKSEGGKLISSHGVGGSPTFGHGEGS